MTEIISKVHCSVVCCITVSLVQVMCSETKSSVFFLFGMTEIIGASLSEPHTGRKRPPRYLSIYLSMYAYVIP